MIKYIIYTQNNCEYCDKAKKRLAKEKAHVEERLLDTTEKIKDLKRQDTILYHKYFYI